MNAKLLPIVVASAIPFHVGNDAFTIEVSTTDGQLAYKASCGPYPYLTETEALQAADQVNSDGSINASEWLNSDGYPMGIPERLYKSMEQQRDHEDELLGIS